MNERVLVVCAHADDEALGAAGTLARHAAAGDTVSLLFLSEGVTARDPSFDFAARRREIDERKEMACAAAHAMGAQEPEFCDLPDNRMDGVDLLDIVKRIEATMAKLGPTVVYTNHANDLNIDHRLAHQAALTACRPLPGASVRRIYAFETASSTEWEPAGLGGSFRPVRYVDISDFVEAKFAAIAAYDHEMRSFPHPRSPEALRAQMMLRGAQVGVKAAEAFMVVREIY
jgi:LmbE family N-acetylglucosaminyl deacetylase